MRLQDLPSDILIEILVRLRLQDVIAFLSVRLHSIILDLFINDPPLIWLFYQSCSSHRKLRYSKYLWISVLKETQKHRNLACPVGTDVSKLDADDLLRIAVRTYRVERNWSQDKPRISMAIKSVPCLPGLTRLHAEKFAILAAIPATSFVILYGRSSGQQWDIILCDTDGVVPTSSVRTGTIYRHAHIDEPGRHLIAVVGRVNRPEYVTF